MSAAGPALIELAHRCQHRLAVLLVDLPREPPGFGVLPLAHLFGQGALTLGLGRR